LLSSQRHSPSLAWVWPPRRTTPDAAIEWCGATDSRHRSSTTGGPVGSPYRKAIPGIAPTPVATKIPRTNTELAHQLFGGTKIALHAVVNHNNRRRRRAEKNDLALVGTGGVLGGGIHRGPAGRADARFPSRVRFGLSRRLTIGHHPRPDVSGRRAWLRRHASPTLGRSSHRPACGVSVSPFIVSPSTTPAAAGAPTRSAARLAAWPLPTREPRFPGRSRIQVARSARGQANNPSP
jgi:hypothetical protein